MSSAECAAPHSTIKWVNRNDTLRDCIFVPLWACFPFELHRLLPLCHLPSPAVSWLLVSKFSHKNWSSFSDTLMHFAPTIFANALSSKKSPSVSRAIWCGCYEEWLVVRWSTVLECTWDWNGIKSANFQHKIDDESIFPSGLVISKIFCRMSHLRLH